MKALRPAIVKWLDQRLQADAAPPAKALLLAAVPALTLLLLALRLTTEAYLAVSLLLVLPIMLVAWYLGAKWSLLMSALVVVTSLVADLGGITATALPAWAAYVNALVRATVFGLVALLVAALRQAYRRQRLLATSDPLTGLGNRARFMDAAETERQRALRFGHPLTVAYFDLDDFKALNDACGHHAGDAVLRLVGAVLRRRLRKIDTAARLGGDEFVILLPGTGAPAGVATAADLQARIVTAMRQHDYPVGVSAGVACFRRAPHSVDAMLHVADQLMYEAKREGKGRLRSAALPDEAGSVGATGDGS